MHPERPADPRATSRGMKTQSSSFNPPQGYTAFPSTCHSPGKEESSREESPKTEKLPVRDFLPGKVYGILNWSHLVFSANLRSQLKGKIRSFAEYKEYNSAHLGMYILTRFCTICNFVCVNHGNPGSFGSRLNKDSIELICGPEWLLNIL